MELPDRKKRWLCISLSVVIRLFTQHILAKVEAVVEKKAPRVPKFVQPLQNAEITEGQRLSFYDEHLFEWMQLLSTDHDDVKSHVAGSCSSVDSNATSRILRSSGSGTTSRARALRPPLRMDSVSWSSRKLSCQTLLFTPAESPQMLGPPRPLLDSEWKVMLSCCWCCTLVLLVLLLPWCFYTLLLLGL